MEVDTGLLISAVLSRPALWDDTHKYHKNRRIIDNLWQEVADEFNEDRIKVKLRWKNIKDYYRSELAKTEISRQDDGSGSAPYQSSWQYFSIMSVIKKTFKSNKARSLNRKRALMSSHVQEDATDYNAIVPYKIEEGESVDEIECAIEQSDLSSFNYNSDDQHVYSLENNNQECKPFATNNSIDERPRKYLKNQMPFGDHSKYSYREHYEEENDDLLFFRSLLPDLQMLSRPKKLELRMSVLKLVYEAVSASQVSPEENGDCDTPSKIS